MDDDELTNAARRVRAKILRLVFDSGSGHVGGALSQTDILVALYGRVLRVDPKRPDWDERDRFVLSKGHGGLGLVAALAEFGVLPESDLATFGKPGSRLGMHLDRRKVPGVELSTGSLGHGLGVAMGIALGAKHQKKTFRTYCLLSDGELYEGSTWEAALSAPAFGLGGLVAIVDRNRLTMDGATEREVPLEPLADKWRAFGWRVTTCDGHDLRALCTHLAETHESAPAIVIAETVKGKGVAFMENDPSWHYGALDSAKYAEALASVERS